ncbi:hypothetical protein Trydic_g7006 [Trypoxylus dichotomus]
MVVAHVHTISLISREASARTDKPTPGKLLIGLESNLAVVTASVRRRAVGPTSARSPTRLFPDAHVTTAKHAATRLLCPIACDRVSSLSSLVAPY